MLHSQVSTSARRMGRFGHLAGREWIGVSHAFFSFLNSYAHAHDVCYCEMLFFLNGLRLFFFKIEPASYLRPICIRFFFLLFLVADSLPTKARPD